MYWQLAFKLRIKTIASGRIPLLCVYRIIGMFEQYGEHSFDITIFVLNATKTVL